MKWRECERRRNLGRFGLVGCATQPQRLPGEAHPREWTILIILLILIILGGGGGYYGYRGYGGPGLGGALGLVIVVLLVLWLLGILSSGVGWLGLIMAAFRR